MSRVKLVVEGPSDVKFLQDFIKVRFKGVNLEKENFIEAGTNNLNPVKGIIEAANERGEFVLLIFDADADREVIKERIDAQVSSFDLSIENQFFFPNNQDPGNLETLLRGVVATDREGVFSCIDTYGECISEYHIPELREFSNKAKMYVYVDSFSVGGAGKPGKTDFTEELLWDLNSEHLNPLYEFLRPYFIE